MGIRDAQHAGATDLRVHQENALDFDGEDALAGAANDFFPASHDGQEPLVVEDTQIAGVYPAVANSALRFVWVVPVLLHHELAAHGDFADRAGRNDVVTVVDEADLDIQIGSAHGLRLAGGITGTQRTDRTGFG